MSTTGGQEVVMTSLFNTDGNAEPPMAAMAPVQHVEEVDPTYKVLNNVWSGVMDPSVRTTWLTFTTKVDTKLFLGSDRLVKSTLEPFKGKDGLWVMLSAQAFQKSFIEVTRDTPVYDQMRKAGEDLTRKSSN
jgi:hypothetical protein